MFWIDSVSQFDGNKYIYVYQDISWDCQSGQITICIIWTDVISKYVSKDF